MKLILLLLLFLIPFDAFASEERDLAGIRAEIEQLQRDQRAEDINFGPGWYVDQHYRCLRIPQDNLVEIINCREELASSHITLVNNREFRTNKIAELEQKIVALRTRMAARHNELRKEHFAAGDGRIYVWVSYTGRTAGGSTYTDGGLILDVGSTEMEALDASARIDLERLIRDQVRDHVSRKGGEVTRANVRAGSFHDLASRRDQAEQECRSSRDCRVENTLENDFRLNQTGEVREAIRNLSMTPPRNSPVREQLSDYCRCHWGTLCLSSTTRTREINGQRVNRPSSVIDPMRDRIRETCRDDNLTDAQKLARVRAISDLIQQAWRDAARDQNNVRQMTEARIASAERQYQQELEAERRAVQEARAEACICGYERDENGSCPDGFDPSRAGQRECDRNPDLACACER